MVLPEVLLNRGIALLLDVPGLDTSPAPRLDRAVAASVAPVPPLATASVPASVIVPDPVTGPPDVVRPVVPPETLTLVTVPVPPIVLQVGAEPEPDEVST